MPRFRLLTRLTPLTALALLSACGTQGPRGVAEVPQCRAAAQSVPNTEFDSRVQVLTMRADAYSECMQKLGYVFDEAELERRMTYKEQVKNADPLGGDPYWILARYRQELRMDPDLWRSTTR